MIDTNKKTIIIAGPTASGKTALSIELANQVDGEIVAADSMQIYKYMDIGTAKPTLEEQEGIPHHMISIVDPKESYSASLYKEDAFKCIKEIYDRNKTPIIVGGTGLYINALTYNLDFSNTVRNEKYRNELKTFAKEKGNKELFKLLLDKDPIAAQRLHENDVKRVIRALEVIETTGKSLYENENDFKKAKPLFPYEIITLSYDRKTLYERIDKRVDVMIKDGLLDEMQSLLEMGVTREMQSMQGIGYKQLFDYFEDKATLKDTIELIKRETRRYAKRQLTWFRHDNRIRFLNPSGSKCFKTQLMDILKIH